MFTIIKTEVIMKWDKEIDKYHDLQEIRDHYEDRLAKIKNPWTRAEYIQSLTKEYQEAIMSYNETVDFHEYIPKLSEFDMLIIKGKMTDTYTDDLDYSIMCDRY
jgi:hypothetical protein